MNKPSLKHLAAAAACALLAPAAGAQPALNYSFLEANYVYYGGDIDADGLRVKGSGRLAPHLFGFGEIQPLSDGRRRFTSSHAGLGLSLPLDLVSDLYVAGSLEYQRVRPGRPGASSRDGLGAGVRGGLRHRLTQEVELGAELRYVDIGSDIDDDYVGFTATFQYHLAPAVGLIVEYDNLDGDSGILVGGRYNF